MILSPKWHTYDTTIGPKTTLGDEATKVDFITQSTVLGQVYDKALAGAPAGIGSIGAAGVHVGSAVGAPSRSAVCAILKKQNN